MHIGVFFIFEIITGQNLWYFVITSLISGGDRLLIAIVMIAYTNNASSNYFYSDIETNKEATKSELSVLKCCFIAQFNYIEHVKSVLERAFRWYK